jgi:hypothetical protein
LLREHIAIVEQGGDPMNVFRDPQTHQIVRIPVEHSLIETAKAGSLSSGQAPYSALLEAVEAAWAKVSAAAD